MLGDENDSAIQSLLQGKDSRVVQIVRKRRMKPPAPTLFLHDDERRRGPLREQSNIEAENKANQYTEARDFQVHGNGSDDVGDVEKEDSKSSRPASMHSKTLETKSKVWRRANHTSLPKQEQPILPLDTSKTPKVTNSRKQQRKGRSLRHKKRVQFQAILATIHDADWALDEEEVHALWYSGEEIEENVEFLGNVDARGCTKKNSSVAHWWETLARVQHACSVMVSKDEYRIHKSSDMAHLRQELAMAYFDNALTSEGGRDYECWGLERMSFDGVRSFYRETMMTYLEHCAPGQEDPAIAASLLQRLSLPFGLFAQELAMAQAHALTLQEKALLEKEQEDYNRHVEEAQVHAPRSPSERGSEKHFSLPKPKNLAAVRKGSTRPHSPTF